jgi:hypothetical protein
LDSLYLNCSYINPVPVYEVQLEKADILLDNQFIDILHYCFCCFKSLFSAVCHPNQFDGSMIYIPSFTDASLYPCSPTRSCNEQLNTILDIYNVYYYNVDFGIVNGDTLAKWIFIGCEFSDIIDLSKALLSLKHLFEEVNISCCESFPDISYDCRPYYSIASEQVIFFEVSPNPTTGELRVTSYK